MNTVRRFSRQRQLIYEAVKNSNRHLTADQIYSQLRPSNPELSLGTVYRNLSVLEEMDLIIKLPGDQGGDRFDARCDPHAHIVCEKCGGMFDVEYDARELVDSLRKGSCEHMITQAHLYLKGVCSGCLKKFRKDSN